MDSSHDEPSQHALQHAWAGEPPAAGEPIPSPERFDEYQDSTLHPTALHQMLLETETVQDFMNQLVHRAAADTGYRCGITVGRPNGQHEAYTLASSDTVSRQLDELQYTDGVGPCLEAWRTSGAVFVTDMGRETRWRDFPRHAAAVGVRSSMSYPLLSGDRCIGAINFYAFEPLAPQVDVQARAGVVAAVAAGALALALRLAERGDTIAHLRTALTSRSTIDQAIGILMAQQRCTARTAFDALRKASQGRNIKLRHVAAGIVASVERGGLGGPTGRY